MKMLVLYGSDAMVGALEDKNNCVDMSLDLWSNIPWQASWPGGE